MSMVIKRRQSAVQFLPSMSKESKVVITVELTTHYRIYMPAMGKRRRQNAVQLLPSMSRVSNIVITMDLTITANTKYTCLNYRHVLDVHRNAGKSAEADEEDKQVSTTLALQSCKL